MSDGNGAAIAAFAIARSTLHRCTVIVRAGIVCSGGVPKGERIVVLALLAFKEGRPADGFDPAPFAGSFGVYQMVPLGGEREIVVVTETLPAEFTFSRAGVAVAGNFRNFGANNAPLPDIIPGVLFTDRPFRLPPRTQVQFTIRGNDSNITVLRGRDVPNGVDIEISLDIVVSVKPPLERRFSFVLVSDLRRPAVRGKIEPRFLLDGVKPIFKDQANVDVIDIDENIGFREIDVHADLRDPVNVEDAVLRQKIDKRLNEIFPDLFSQTHFIVYILWHLRGKFLKQHLVGLHVQTPDNLNTVYLGLDPASFTGQVHVMAHEFGHAMGLNHLPNVPNLMFPTTSFLNNNIKADHIENLQVENFITP